VSPGTNPYSLSECVTLGRCVLLLRQTFRQEGREEHSSPQIRAVDRLQREAYCFLSLCPAVHLELFKK